MTVTVRILVAEDELVLQEFVEDALSEGGFEVQIARSGDEAFSLFRDNPQNYRALLTDIGIGAGLNGWALARKVREVDPDFPIVYMTGSHAEDWNAHGVPNSVLIEKPFAPAQLLTAIAQLLNKGTTPA